MRIEKRQDDQRPLDLVTLDILRKIWSLNKAAIKDNKKINISVLHIIRELILPLYALMDIMWPISQSHFHVSCLCSFK